MTTPLPSIALAGNPNSGKSTVFNRLTGLRQRVGNYPGITVEKTSGRLDIEGVEADVIDLPGAYSLIGRSHEEVLAYEVLQTPVEEGGPSLILLVLDASNLARNLYFALSVLELGRPTIIVLNMIDEARAMGFAIDSQRLGDRLKVPVVPVVASTGEGVEKLKAVLKQSLEEPPKPAVRSWRFDDEVESTLRAIADEIPSGHSSAVRDAQASWLLGIAATEALCANGPNDAERSNPSDPVELPHLRTAADFARALPLELRTQSFSRMIEARHRFASEIEREVTTDRLAFAPEGAVSARATEGDRTPRSSRPFVGDRSFRLEPTLSDRIDHVVLHRVFGPIIFIGVMALVFQSIFAWSVPLMDAIDAAFSDLSRLLHSSLPPGPIVDLLTDGVITGVGSVLVFVPQIGILFAFIALLEDSGYLARAAFIMDRLMATVGLHGKAFVPLVSGFACAVPAIMSARTVENPKDRLVTILITPLMSCSARLPVYTVIIGALFSSHPPLFGVLSVGALLMLTMYLLSVLAALSIGALFKRTILRSSTPPLVLELPPYRMPLLGSVVRRAVSRCGVFVRDAGTVILACSIVLWALLTYPKTDTTTPERMAERAAIESALSGEARERALASFEDRRAAEAVEGSIAGRLGRFMEPVIEPLGFDWRIGIGLIASFAAREVLVSTLGLVHGLGASADADSLSLREIIRRDPKYTPLVGLSLMVFFLFACQCMSTLAVVRRETSTWRWPMFVFAYMTSLAYVASFLVYQTGRLLGFGA